MSSINGPVIYSVFPRNHGRGGVSAVTEDLHRIASLGVEYVWLLPVYPTGRWGRKGSLGSPYAIRDHRSVDPALGSECDLVALIDTAHRNGIGVMMDLVFNHVSPDSLIATGHPEWLYRDGAGNPMPRVGDWSDVVDLDYGAPGLAEHQIATMAHWLSLGIDGFRCDVAPLVPMWFWERARAELDRRFGHTLWIAESTDAPFQELLASLGVKYATDGELLEVFDLCYDYANHPSLKAVHTGALDVDEFLREKMAQRTAPAARVMNFLENHDHPRAASFIAADLLPTWVAFALLYPGASLLFAGGEFGSAHTPSLFDADPMSLNGPAGGARQVVSPGLLADVIRIRYDARQRGPAQVSHVSGGAVRISWGRRRRTSVIMDLGGELRGQSGWPANAGTATGALEPTELAPGVVLVTGPAATPA